MIQIDVKNNNLLKNHVIGLLVVFLLFLHLLLIWPGYFSPDSAAQYQMAIQGVYSDHHPPLMSFVWRYLNYIVSGPGMMLLLQLSFLYGSIFYLINSVKKLGYISLLLIVLPIVPQVMRYSSTIWKDAHFAFSFLFIASYLAYLTVNKLKLKWYQFIGLLIILLYGTAVKFQAQYCAPVLLIWMVYAVLDYKFLHKKIFGILGGLLIFFYGCLNTINYILIPNVKKDYSWQQVKLYDLAGISMAINQDLFPNFSKNSNFTMQQLFNKFDYCKSFFNCKYSRYTVDDLLHNPYPPGVGPILKKCIDDKERRELYFTWVREVLRHPLAYCKHRITNMIGILCGVPVAFKYFHQYFEYNSISYMIFDVAIRLIISNFIYAMLSVIYFICGLYILYKTRNNVSRFAIPLVMFNAISVIMLVVLFFCSLASTPRYTYISMCMVHSSHLFAYLCFRDFKKDPKMLIKLI